MDSEWFEPVKGERMRVLLGGEESDGNALVLETITSAQCGPPTHAHGVETEVFYCVSGLLQVIVEEETHTLEPGQCFTVPPGVFHRYRNFGSEPLRAVLSFYPSGRVESFLRGLEGLSRDDPDFQERALAHLEAHGVVAGGDE